MKNSEKIDDLLGLINGLTETAVEQSKKLLEYGEALMNHKKAISELENRIEDVAEDVEDLEESEDEEDDEEEEPIDSQAEYNMKVQAIARTAVEFSPSADYAFYLLSSAAAHVHSSMIEQPKETK